MLVTNKSDVLLTVAGCGQWQPGETKDIDARIAQDLKGSDCWEVEDDRASGQSEETTVTEEDDHDA
jgi:hypothetical protein